MAAPEGSNLAPRGTRESRRTLAKGLKRFWRCRLATIRSSFHCIMAYGSRAEMRASFLRHLRKLEHTYTCGSSGTSALLSTTPRQPTCGKWSKSRLQQRN
ncbi:hypothetical protein BC567DRAFT_214378 [Phyllosticta citribraziliensis]